MATEATNVVESKFMLTYTYTTSTVSGSVKGTPEFFADEMSAITRYLGLRWGNGNIKGAPERQLVRSSVTLSTHEGWRVVIGSNERATA